MLPMSADFVHFVVVAEGFMGLTDVDFSQGVDILYQLYSLIPAELYGTVHLIVNAVIYIGREGSRLYV